MYERYSGPRFRLSLEEAETVKYWDNAFHAVKITFANEMGALARAAGVDARRVSEVFCADTKLNISPRYLKPGFAFGGSCLPKDLRATLREAAIRSIRVPMIEGALLSNVAQIESLLLRILAQRPRRVGMVGLAFKPDTDDMRESPYVTVAKRLIGEGITLRIYDPGVRPAELIGRNRELVQASLGHLESLLAESLDHLSDCDLILVNHPTVDAARVASWTGAGKQVIDLASIAEVPRKTPGYEGIAW
jgi:GDP-mannose 6-dehydrogenase